MIAKQSFGKSFMGALDYNLKKMENPDPGQAATLLESNSQSMDRNQILAELAIMKQMNPRLQRNTWHTSLNFPKGDQLSDKKMLGIAKEYMTKMGFDNNLYFIFRHHDAGHTHAHVLALRNRFDGSVVSDSNNFRKSERIIRELEKKYHLQETASSKKALSRAPTKNEIEMAIRTGRSSTKMGLQDKVALAIQHSRSVSEFIQNLERQKIHPQFNQASTGQVSGISFSYRDFLIKGQKLGRQFTWGNIIKQMDYEKTRDRQEISQANDRTRGILDSQSRTSGGRVASANRGNETGSRRGESAIQRESAVVPKRHGGNGKHNRESADSSSGNSGSEKRDSGFQESQGHRQLDPENGLFRTDHRGGNKFGNAGGLLNELRAGEEEIENSSRKKRRWKKR
jgi:hypothetical protein